MQIHELTQKQSNEQLNEQQGIVTGLYDLAKSFNDPRMKGMPVGARMRAMAGDRSVALIGKAVYSQWLQKVAQLQKQQMAQLGKQPAATGTQPPAAGAQPPVAEAKQPGYVDIGETAYKKYLLDFVNKSLFKGDIAYLEPENKSQLDQTINSIVAVRDDPAALQKAFSGLALIAANAMFTSPQYQQQQAKNVTSTGKAAAPGPVTPETVKSLISQLGVDVKANPRALGQVFAKAAGNNDLRVNRTGNEYANTLLELFGFEVR